MEGIGSMHDARPEGYSTLQIMLHWGVATLVAFQFFVNDGIDDAWRAFVTGGAVEAEQMAAANVHVVIGLVILALALCRIVLRLTRGVLAPPPNEPRALQLAASGAHLALYVLLILTPLSGAAAWFFEAEPAAAAHGVFRALLFIVVLLHIAGAFVQLLVFRSDVFWRILMTRD
jgi:cytochrome b561